MKALGDLRKVVIGAADLTIDGRLDEQQRAS
jgi:hypothetical protein